MENQTPNLEAPSLPAKPWRNGVMLVLLSLLAILLVSVVFLYYQNQQLKEMLADYQNLPSPTPVATTNPSVDWESYTNEKHGFSIDYPKNWTISKTPLKIIFQSNSDPSIEIDLENNADDKCITNDQALAEEITITTQSGSFNFCKRMLITENETITSRFEDKFKIVTNTGNAHSPEFTKNRNLLIQILSTFRFFDKETFDWQTYRGYLVQNKAYSSYTIKYPNNCNQKPDYSTNVFECKLKSSTGTIIFGAQGHGGGMGPIEMIIDNVTKNYTSGEGKLTMLKYTDSNMLLGTFWLNKTKDTTQTSIWGLEFNGFSSTDQSELTGLLDKMLNSLTLSK